MLSRIGHVQVVINDFWLGKQDSNRLFVALCGYLISMPAVKEPMEKVIHIQREIIHRMMLQWLRSPTLGQIVYHCQCENKMKLTCTQLFPEISLQNANSKMPLSKTPKQKMLPQPPNTNISGISYMPTPNPKRQHLKPQYKNQWHFIYWHFVHGIMTGYRYHFRMLG